MKLVGCGDVPTVKVEDRTSDERWSPEPLSYDDAILVRGVVSEGSFRAESRWRPRAVGAGRSLGRGIGVEGNLPQVFGDFAEQSLVERFARNHGQRMRSNGTTDTTRR